MIISLGKRVRILCNKLKLDYPAVSVLSTNVQTLQIKSIFHHLKLNKMYI